MSKLLDAEEARDFKKLLENYQPNNQVLDLFRHSKFSVIAGPAGAGKDTLRNSLTAKYPDNYLPILSTTTRPVRSGEVDGQTYHFRTAEQVKQGLKDREFFQGALVHNQQVSCLHINEINKLAGKKTGLSILIVTIEAELRNIKPDISTVFLIPPDYETLMVRINAERMLDQSEIDRRLQAARDEIGFALNSPRYYCLVTSTVSHVTEVAHAFLQTGRADEKENIQARGAMAQILKSIPK